MTPFDIAVSIALGIGLAAATGFRIFLPLLITSIATYGGYIPVSEGFAWIGSPAAVIMLGVAALAEVLAYYIPGVDNLLDTIATPAALVAGTLVSAAVMADLPPLIKWTAAVIAGGGAAGITQGVTTMIRANSTVFTGGLGNPVDRHGRAWRGDARLALGAFRALRGRGPRRPLLLVRGEDDPATAEAHAKA